MLFTQHKLRCPKSLYPVGICCTLFLICLIMCLPYPRPISYNQLIYMFTSTVYIFTYIKTYIYLFFCTRYKSPCFHLDQSQLFWSSVSITSSPVETMPCSTLLQLGHGTLVRLPTSCAYQTQSHVVHSLFVELSIVMTTMYQNSIHDNIYSI